jgi:hypothetical protein
VVDRPTSNNLKRILVDAMVLYGGLILETMASKLITFGADKVNVFQGVRIRVTIQLKDQNVPFMIRIHCTTHRTNLVVQTFKILAIVQKIENVLKNSYSYFCNNPKRTQKFVKLANILETKGQHVFNNIKTLVDFYVTPSKDNVKMNIKSWF